MKKMLTISFAAIIACQFCLFGSASAQWKDNMGGNWNNPTSASIGNIVNDSLWNRVFAKARARDKARAAASQPTGTQPPSAQPVGASTRSPAQIDAAVSFRSTGTQLETQGIAAELAGGDAELKKDLITIITALVNEYEKAAKAEGRPNDLALATTAALIYNSSIYSGTTEPSDARIMEIRDALAELMVEGNTFRSMTDRQKQVLYEKLVISTMLAKAGYEEAKEKGDKETMATYRVAAGQTLTMVSGLAPGKIDFSNEATRRNAERLLNSDPPKQPPAAQKASSTALSNADYLDFDPFPDKPHFQAQQPLTGRLRKTITMADLAGTWEIDGASVMEYISSSSQSQTSASFGRTKYVIRGDGTYQGSFQGRASNTTIRESESGTIILSGGFIIKRDSNNREMKYQFVAYMIQPNGAAILSLIFIGESAPFDAEGLRAQCGHAHGYITCLNSDEWVRKP